MLLSHNTRCYTIGLYAIMMTNTAPTSYQILLLSLTVLLHSVYNYNDTSDILQWVIQIFY